MAALVLSDAFGFLLALGLGWTLRCLVLPRLFAAYRLTFPAGFWANAWWMLGLNVLCLASQGVYVRRLPFWRETRRLAVASSLTFLLVLGGVSLAQKTHEVSRTLLLLAFPAALASIATLRWVAKRLLFRVGLWQRPVVVLGTGETARMVACALAADRHLGYRVVGYLVPGNCGMQMTVEELHYPVLGTFSDAEEVLNRYRPCDAVVAEPDLEPSVLVQLVNRLQGAGLSVIVVPGFVGLPVVGVEADYLFEQQALVFRIPNNLASPVNVLLKRCVDLLVGTVILVLALPVMAGAALAVRLNSPGPVLFGQPRLGRGGKVFTCYKFRTMYVDAERILADLLEREPSLRQEWARGFKLQHDPRVTRVGRFLRRFSLDELPQLFNVLKGEMSLVGPRPRPLYECDCRDDAGLFDLGLSVRPGLTGLWQVSGRSQLHFLKRVDLDAWYARNWSLWLDVVLLFRTFGVVLKRDGAY